MFLVTYKRKNEYLVKSCFAAASQTSSLLREATDRDRYAKKHYDTRSEPSGIRLGGLSGRGPRGFWHETTPLKDLSHACQLEIRGLNCKCRSAINETLQPRFIGEYRFSLMAS